MTIRNKISDELWIRSVRRNRTRLGWRDAEKYTEHLEVARKQAPQSTRDPELAALASQYRTQAWCAFSRDSTRELARSMLEKLRAEEAKHASVWDSDGRYGLGDIFLRFPEVDQLFQGDIGEFLRAAYGTHFKIFYGICYKSVHDPNGPQGSQLWHADGGPGTCMNLMWCLSPVASENGAMECLPWDASLDLFTGERAATRGKIAEARQAARSDVRKIISDYYRINIEDRYKDRIVQPRGDFGLVFAFSNNTLHKGGYPLPGHERYVCVFHIYPSDRPTAFDRYRTSGIAKTAAFPMDPGFE